MKYGNRTLHSRIHGRIVSICGYVEQQRIGCEDHFGLLNPLIGRMHSTHIFEQEIEIGVHRDETKGEFGKKFVFVGFNDESE